jgi:hypothetical protein
MTDLLHVYTKFNLENLKDKYAYAVSSACVVCTSSACYFKFKFSINNFIIEDNVWCLVSSLNKILVIAMINNIFEEDNTKTEGGSHRKSTSMYTTHEN